MNKKVVVGFDFGTTNSLVSSIIDGRAINFLDEEGLPYPSIVCYEGSRALVGREAKERLGEAGLGIKGNIVRSPKILLGRESVFIEGVERNPVDIVADVVRYISQQTAAGRMGRLIENIDKAVVTIPIDMEGSRRALLRDAFRLAGINIYQFVHEPLAALYGYFRSQEDMDKMLRQYNRKLILVFDWGGGTLDLTLCRLVNGMLIQITNDGTEDVGGDRFDEVIKNEVVNRVIEARGLDNVQHHRDAMKRLLHSCERAKIDLSTRDRVHIYVPGFFRAIEDEDLDYSLSRVEMENFTAQLLDKGFSRIERVLESADISPAQIAMCLATGGMASMPAVKARLHEWFGPQRVRVPEDRSATLIAEGAAWIAHDKAKLKLAKNVELLLARNSYMSLVRAGTTMPSEGDVQKRQFHLYCTDPRDGFAKFQICSPSRPGPKVLPNDHRNILENMILEVDEKAKPFYERIELNINIDDNLILKAKARSLNRHDTAEGEVHNLEFGITLLRNGVPGDEVDEIEDVTEDIPDREKGTLVFRANIADRKNKSLVPGELLYTYDQSYFDVRFNPPDIQVKERLYYEPCCICGRASNDPLCKCDTRH